MALIDKYSKSELEELAQQSNSLRELIVKAGYSTPSGNNGKTVKKRLEKFGISTEHFGTMADKPMIRTTDNVFMENSTASQATLRRWYEKEDIEYQCVICGQDNEWQGKPLTLILDHINGINNDNRLENLRWVCPNCNQQLETTGYKSMRSPSIPVERDELKELIRNLPINTLAKKFQVSETTIRRWCDKLNLPNRKQEINKYLNEEWELI